MNGLDPAELQADLSPSPAPAVAAVFVSGLAGDFLPTVASLSRAHPGMTVLIGGPQPDALTALDREGSVRTEAASLGHLVSHAQRLGARHVLAVLCPTVLPSVALAPALALLDAHLSVATISFLSNAAGHASFPHLGRPVAHQPEGLDQDALTQRLRGTEPEQVAAPVPYATGPLTLLSGPALSAVGDLDVDLAPAPAIADFSLRARRRGFVNLLDPSTYCAHMFDGALPHDCASEISAPDQRWLVDRHPFLPAAQRQALAAESPLSIAHATARSKVLGVSVLVDGSCLGRREMGTQVQTVALVRALARSSDVDRVAVALATDVPGYAAPVLGHRKVTARMASPADLSAFGAVDVVHRPFQPDGPLDVDGWRSVGRRTVLTVLDLISYRTPAYHPSTEGWMSYRQALEAAVARVDGVVTGSVDVAEQIRMERLPVGADRLMTVALGSDHLGGNDRATIPAALLERGYGAGEFILVMGANYAHKNRDIALRVQVELRRRGFDLALVAAGANVPFGSSRTSEASVDGQGPVFFLPDLPAEERNWLLRHASLVLYPTSAEGFGFVPSEAAWFGTPTVFVPVGPLGEIYGQLPVTPRHWGAGSLADAAEQLLADPGLARAQVEAVRAASARYTWEETAARLVTVYRTLLSLPPRTERPAVHD